MVSSANNPEARLRRSFERTPSRSSGDRGRSGDAGALSSTFTVSATRLCSRLLFALGALDSLVLLGIGVDCVEFVCGLGVCWDHDASELTEGLGVLAPGLVVRDRPASGD